MADTRRRGRHAEPQRKPAALENANQTFARPGPSSQNLAGDVGALAASRREAADPALEA
jgi:hypothetical protein